MAINIRQANVQIFLKPAMSKFYRISRRVSHFFTFQSNRIETLQWFLLKGKWEI